MKKVYNRPELELETLIMTDVLYGSQPTASDWVSGPGMDNGGF